MQRPPDLARFADALRGATPAPLADGVGPIAACRAPGRLDVLGGDVEFAGALVLQAPSDWGCIVAARRARDEERRVVVRAGDHDVAAAEWSVDELLEAEGDALTARLLASPHAAWAAPLALVLPVLVPRLGARAAPGLRLWVTAPSLPNGVLPQAALAVAGLRAAAAAFALDLTAEEAAGLAHVLCSRLRPLAGPAGPLVIAEGRAGHVTPVLCQPARAFEALALPPGCELVGIVASEPPSPLAEPPAHVTFRTAAAIAYRLIAAHMGLTVQTHEAGEPQEVEDPYFDGYLANIDPVSFAAELRDGLPEELSGAQFLLAHGGVADRQVRIDPAARYAVRASALRVVAEHQRACAAVDLLHRTGAAAQAAGAPDTPAAAAACVALGAALEASGLEAKELGVAAERDLFLVTELRRRGRARGVLGARASGIGAPVVVLLRTGAENGGERSLQEAIAAFEREFGASPLLLRGSSPGAFAPESLICPS